MSRGHISRFYVNFPSPVDGKILCKFFKTREQAERFAKDFSLRCYYGIDYLECYKGTLSFIDQEIYNCDTDENYKFRDETHYSLETKYYI